MNTRKINLRKSALVLVAGLLLLMLGAETALACPTCKDSLAGDPAMSNMVRGYFWSILFMMSMPFLIFGGLGAYFYYEIRRARAKSETLPADSRAVRSPGA